ncbi:MAG: hypothetical protein HYT07_01705 [Candidatus Levybacteria bacterium]|nr:hypothetical protein [Candidatus Levybacteria bacterium]
MNSTKTLNISLNNSSFAKKISQFWARYHVSIIITLLIIASVFAFGVYYLNGLGLSYNDARSHLDIGRRVVEGLKPGLAQLGSVWLPLPHILMVPTIWNDFFWHSGLSGAIQSMVSFVTTAVIIYMFLKKIGVSIFGRIIGVLIFTLNLNILYLQSTAMTELLLIATMTTGVYYLMLWSKDERILDLIKSAFFVMLSTLVRYDGWFLLILSIILIAIEVLRKKGYKVTEGTVILFATLAGFGVALWFLWNLLIFKDALYFIYGPYSARAQQLQLEEAGVLATKGDIFFSTKVYLYALLYSSNAFITILGSIGAVIFWLDKKIKTSIKIVSTALFAPLAFNILALYLGHSVLFVQGLSGDTWFNVRYGVMMMPPIAIFVGYLTHKATSLKYVLVGLITFVLFFSFVNLDAVTIDDARVGSSQKNVSEVSNWLKNNADKDGFILISAASHDAIIFSSGFPMSKFIHEGTGAYWESATISPDRWARWIVMRTNDVNDSTFKLVSESKAYELGRYTLVNHYPFADIYEIKPEFVENLNTEFSIRISK